MENLIRKYVEFVSSLKFEHALFTLVMSVAALVLVSVIGVGVVRALATTGRWLRRGRRQSWSSIWAE